MREARSFEETLNDEKAPSRRRFAASKRASDLQRLAGHDGEIVFAWMESVVRVVNPCHRLVVCVHVWPRDVRIRADVVTEFADKTTCNSAQLAGTQLFRVTDDAAFGPTVG